MQGMHIMFLNALTIAPKMVGRFIHGRRCINMKLFIIGAIPIGLFMYLVIFYTEILVYAMMLGGFVLASYLTGEAIKEEFSDIK